MRAAPFRKLAVTGLLAALAAAGATTAGAALARAVGVDFEVPAGGEAIPLPGFAVVTTFFSLVGVVIAAALLRWGTRPREQFVATAVTLMAASLLPPFLVDASPGTVVALVVLHLVAASVVIPAISRVLTSVAPAPTVSSAGRSSPGRSKTGQR